MNNRPSALGRGLGSLIPSKNTITEQVMPSLRRDSLEIPTDKITENPHQPRKRFDPAELENLIASIREHGIIQPIIVTQQGDGYELVAGERRLRSARALGLPTVPAVIREATEQQKLELALIENIQRQDLNPVEEAYAYKALIEEFNLTHAQVAKRAGKSRPEVSNTLRLLDLSEEMLLALNEQKISKSHARTLLAERNLARREEMYLNILHGNVSVREMEARVQSTPYALRKSQPNRDPNIVAHERKLQELFGTIVTIKEAEGKSKGMITIEFYSREELFSLLDRLTD